MIGACAPNKQITTRFKEDEPRRRCGGDTAADANANPLSACPPADARLGRRDLEGTQNSVFTVVQMFRKCSGAHGRVRQQIRGIRRLVLVSV
ncbi:unnamed protein product [Lota lota]